MNSAGTRSAGLALLIVLGTLIGASSAFAADLQVETTGTDSGTCGAPGDPCASIAQATTNAISGDRVVIGAGTFTQTASINPGAKSIEYDGAGAGSTIVTGNNSNSFATSGLFSFRSAGATVAVRNLQVTGFPGIGATGSRFGIWIQPNPANPASAINATISGVRFVGVTSPPAGVFENAVYAANNNGAVTIQDCEISDVMANSLLLENQRGAATVTGTAISKSTPNASSAIYDMLHQTGATNWDQTGLHSFTDNTITNGSAIAVVGGFAPTNTLGADSFPIGVTISGNQIDTSSSTTSAIALVNAANDNIGTAGQIDNALITGNTITAGTGGGNGITLQGGIPDAQITGNNIRNRSNGISLTRRTQSAAPNTTWNHKPDGATISANQVVDNTSGLTTDSGVAVTADADGNWWGCNAGPPIGSAPVAGDCDSVSTFDSSSLTLASWAVLGVSATSNTLASDGSDTVTAGFASDNLGGAAPQIFANGTVLPLSAANGTLSDANPALASSFATTTFTSTSPSGRTATAAYDHQAVTWAWQDTGLSPPVITITSPSNGSVISESTATLTYTVNKPSTCSPPSGSSVDLNVGVNTIVVTCVDDEGAVGTANVTVVRPDALPQCARDVVITSVQRSGSQTRLAGVARLRFVGQRVALQYEPSGNKTIARPIIQADGSWRTVVNRPNTPDYRSNKARYRAVVNSPTKSWIKLTRRMGATAITSIGEGNLRVSGSVTQPIGTGQPLRVMRSDSCGNFRQVGWLKVSPNGTFRGTVPDGGPSESAVFFRLQVRVHSTQSGTRFNTYSISQPVVLTR